MLVEKWAEKDVIGFLQQIGVMPSPGRRGLSKTAGILEVLKFNMAEDGDGQDRCGR
jgi:hypothetical protein